MKTSVPKADQIKRDWYVIDASEAVLGRLATKVATILRGKHKPYFSYHLDVGDYVVVTNAAKVRLTRNKELQKTYQRYSGYPGGLTVIPFRRMMQDKPENVITHAVRGMLPKNILGRSMIKKLKVYAGNDHPHKGQKPKTLSIGR